jgi:hypothetical protein
MPDGIRIELDLDTRVLDAIVLAAPGRVEQALDRIVGDIETVAKVSFAEPKTGRIYRRGATAKHQASAPGRAPAIDYGILAASWTVQRRRGQRTFGFAAEYAAHLEFGTTRMAARPYFLPAIVKGARGLIGAARAIAENGTVLAEVKR